MGPKLIAPDEWMDKTFSIGKTRSKELKDLDAALSRYHLNAARDDASLNAVKKAFDVWKRTQGTGDAWKKSARNKTGIVEMLDTLLTKGADSDSAWGKFPDFMHESMVNSRLGVLYLFGNMAVNPKLFNIIVEGGLSITGSFVSYAGLKVGDGGLGNTQAALTSQVMPSVMVIGNDILDGAWSGSQKHVVQPALRGKLESVSQAIRNWFKEFAEGIVESLKEKWNCEIPGALLKTVTNGVCSAVLDVTSAGIVSGVMDTVRGTITSADAIVNKVRAWKGARGVEFASGHPSTVVDSINRGMWMSIGEGLWQLLKGAGNIGIAFGSAGAGLIMGVVIAGAEFLAKLIYRLYEVLHMEKFFGEAAMHWRNKDAPDGLHRQPWAFGQWFRKYALNTPALGILALTSGICGDKMIYLSMFKQDNTPVTSEEFLRGAAHLDSLKVWGLDYLKKAGFSFRGTTEQSVKMVQFATASSDLGMKVNQANLSGGEKVWDYVKRFGAA